MKGKDVLNFFFYIGSVLVFVVKGGVKLVIIVDMFKIYLDWVKKNVVLNKL